jgi:large subunit ribosomal protein L3
VAIELMCRKIGMTQVYDEAGTCIPVTVLEAGPNVVVQKKTLEKDGYSAVQLGFGQRRPSLFSKAQRGHFEKANTAPRRYVRESRISPDELESYEVAKEIDCSVFEEGQRVDVIGTTKGCGTQGVVKRHGFKVMRRTHGTHESHRHPGSIGAGAYPGRVFKGTKLPGRMGNERQTLRNLVVVRVDAERNLLYVRGGVPGHNNGLVRVRVPDSGSS